MFKKKIALVTVISAILAAAFVCSAQGGESIKVSADNVTRVVTITGEEWPVPEANLAVEILRPDEEITSDMDPNKVFARIDQLTVKSDGTFDYTFTLAPDSESGQYTVRLYAYGDSNVAEKKFEFRNISSCKKAIAKMQGSTAKDIKGILDVSAVDFDISFSCKYKSLSENEKLYVAEELHNNMSSDYDTLMLIINNAVKRIEILSVIKSGNRSEAKKALDDNMNLLGITDDAALKVYNNSKYTGNMIIKFIAAVQSDGITPDKLPGIFAQTAADVKKSIDETAGGASGSGGKGLGSSGTSGGSSSVYSFGEISPALSDPPIEAAYEEERFSDMAGFEWAKKAVYRLAEEGIVNGKSEDGFCPADLITREEFAKLIFTAFNIDPSRKPLNFEDTDANEWYYEYVAALVQKGIVNGISENSFGVGQPISRQDMAVILYRTAEAEKFDFPVISDETSIADLDSAQAYSKDAIIMLGRCGIVRGNEKNMFMPNSNATRAEAAQMLYNMLYALSII